MDGQHLTLALVEAQVGSLVEVLPIALLVTSAEGEVLRANTAAVELFGPRRPLVGSAVRSLLPFMHDADTHESVRGAIYSCERIRPVDVRLRHLQHAGEVVRLYVIHG
jgi:PAS domain-containing protein